MISKKIVAAALTVLFAGIIMGAQGLNKGAISKIEDRSTVCMLKNRTLGKPFIPVLIDGKTYYGCCEMCTGTLQKIPKERFATDPVTGRQVDKATAVMGALPSGEVLYFENEKSLSAFSR